MLTAQRKTVVAGQRKASVPQPRGAVVVRAHLGDAVKGAATAALAAALVLGSSQPAFAEFNKEAVENVNRANAEVTKTIIENKPSLSKLVGNITGDNTNKDKASNSLGDISSGADQARNPLNSDKVKTGEKYSAEGGKFTGLFQADESK